MSDFQNVMVDLETMGTRPGSVIVSIGAIEFDPQSARLGRTFYQTCSIKSAVDVGLAMDPETVTWWLQQSEGARGELIKAKGDIKSTGCFTPVRTLGFGAMALTSTTRC